MFWCKICQDFFLFFIMIIKMFERHDSTLSCSKTCQNVTEIFKNHTSQKYCNDYVQESKTHQFVSSYCPMFLGLLKYIYVYIMFPCHMILFLSFIRKIWYLCFHEHIDLYFAPINVLFYVWLSLSCFINAFDFFWMAE